MEQPPSSLSDPKLWVSFVALLVSGWAAFNSWRSRQMASRALSISEKQEQRRQPQLFVYMADGFRRYLPDKQLFGFLVSISNPSDINNSVAQAELQIGYILDNGIKAVCRILHNPALAESTPGATGNLANLFALPARIDAHQTVAGWLVFALDNSIIGDNSVDSHHILLEDSHGVSTEKEPVLLKDWTDEAPKN